MGREVLEATHSSNIALFELLADFVLFLELGYLPQVWLSNREMLHDQTDV